MDKYHISPQAVAELANQFTYHRPHGNQAERYEQLRSHGYLLAELILELTPPSPEQTIAVATIREAIMWANAAIACHEQPPTEVADHVTPR